MRLGDLDALKEQIKNDYCKNQCLLPYAESYCPSNCLASYFIKIIDNAPTISPFKVIGDFIESTNEDKGGVE